MALVVRRTASGKRISLSELWLDKFTEADLHDCLDNWFKAYDGRRRNLQTWLDALTQGTHRLWPSIVGPVIDYLYDHGAEHAVWIPTGKWVYLPLHAVWKGTEKRPHYAMDDIVFSYAPSAQTLQFARRFAETSGDRRLLAVADPQPVTQGDSLWHAAQEVQSVLAYFDDRVCYSRYQATQANILKSLPEATVAHFACHGLVDWSNPGQSGLLLANDELLTVDELSKLHLKSARLATLSACGTGIVGARLPSEVVSLPTAFLRAGFAGVIASLWSVVGISTALLMAEFYRQWLDEKKAPNKALRDSQVWLRKATAGQLNLEKIYLELYKTSGKRNKRAARTALYYRRHPEEIPFIHPYYWAAFTLVGV